MEKLCGVKECLRLWNKEEFSVISENIKDLIEEIDLFDKIVNIRSFLEVEV